MIVNGWAVDWNKFTFKTFEMEEEKRKSKEERILKKALRKIMHKKKK